MRRATSATLLWRTVPHRMSVALLGAILLLALGLLGLQVTGYRYFPVRGDSMEPASSAGSLLIARLTAPKDIRPNDFIVFPKASQPTPFIAHRVRLVLRDGERAVAITKGDNNSTFDSEPLNLDTPVARVVLIIPRVGWFVTLSTVWRLWAINAVLGLTVLLPWLAERRTTLAFLSHPRDGLWTRSSAEKEIGMTLSLNGDEGKGGTQP